MNAIEKKQLRYSIRCGNAVGYMNFIATFLENFSELIYRISPRLINVKYEGIYPELKIITAVF